MPKSLDLERDTTVVTANSHPSHAMANLIAELVKRPDVQSVSCPFNNEDLWRLLVQEQIRRQSLSGLHLQHAFGLSGPDGGLPFDPADWGGYVHIPYEGACDADLFINPDWRRFDLNAGMGSGSLMEVTLNKPCHHLLVKGHHKETDCATRTQGADWTLYTSKRQYEPCNPFLGIRYETGEKSLPPIPFHD